MKLIIPLVIVCLVVSGCQCLTGSGNVVSEERTVESFDSIKILGSGNVYFSQGEASPLVISGDDNLLEHVKTYVSGGTLIVEPKECFTRGKITVTVSTPTIKRLTIEGSGKMEAMNGITSDSLDVSISGSGNVRLMGTITDMRTHIMGSGKIEAYDVVSQNSNVRIDGSGTVYVNAAQELDVTILGSGTVMYKGTPQVSQSVSGSGKIRSAET